MCDLSAMDKARKHFDKVERNLPNRITSFRTPSQFSKQHLDTS